MWRCCSTSRRCARARRSRSPSASSAATSSRCRPDVALGRREPVDDVARNLERWVDAVVIRTFSQTVLGEFAAAARRLHVINALTDEEHPCQAIADFLTLQRALGTAARPDDRVRRRRQQRRGLARPRRPRCSACTCTSRARRATACRTAVVRQAAAVARHGARLRLFTDPAEAVAGADAIYTDTWTSMGQEAEAAIRAPRVRALPGERCADGGRQRPARSSCTACRRTAARRSPPSVFESTASVVFDQAENRLHAQKALLLMLLAPTRDVRRTTNPAESRRIPNPASPIPARIIAARCPIPRRGSRTTTPACPRRSRRTRTARCSTTSRTRARERPDHPALLFKGTTITYGQLERLSDACAAAFPALGIRRGDRVGLLLPNCPQFFVAELGAWKLGAIVAPLNPIYTEHELEGPSASTASRPSSR